MYKTKKQNTMMYFRLLLVALFFSLFISCNNTNKHKDDISQAKISIDVNNITNNLSYSDFFDQTSITPLETRPNCMIKEVNKSVYSNGMYYILDERQGAVFAFNTQGEFVFKIHKKGKGPDEYLALEDFNLNPFSNTIDLLSPLGKILQYNRNNGQFINSIQLSGVRAVHAFQFLSRDTIVLFHLSEESKISIYSITENKVVDRQHKVARFVHRYIPQYLNHYPFYKFKDKLHLFEYYSGSLKIFENGKFIEKIKWDFGEYNFDISKIKPDQDRTYYMNYIKNNPHLIRFAFIHEDTNKLVLQFTHNKRLFTLIYSKYSNNYTILSEFKEGVHFPQNPQFVDNKEFFVISPASQVKHYLLESNLDKSQLKLFQQLKVDDNPVVISYKISSEK